MIEPDELSTLISDILRELGPCGVQDIVDALLDDDVEVGPDPDLAVLDVLEADYQPFLELADDRWAHAPTTLAGRTFTHRVTADEIAYDILTAQPDLVVFDWFDDVPELHQLAGGGGPLRVVMRSAPGQTSDRELPHDALDPLGSLRLPVGTLDGLGITPGDLVGLTYHSDGIRVTVITEAPDLDAMEPLRAYLSETLEAEPHRPELLVQLLATAWADEPSLPTTMAPLGELLASWGFAYRDHMVAAPGFDWDLWLRSASRRRPTEDTLTDAYDLSEEEAEAVLTLLAYVTSSTRAVEGLRERTTVVGIDPETLGEDELYGLLGEIATETPITMPDLEKVRHSLSFLDDPLLAEVIAEESLAIDALQPGIGLGAATDGLLELADHRSRPALHWLRSRAFDRLGDVAAVERELRTAERLDREYWPALVDLARLAGDRGDAATGLALLSRAPEEVSPHLRSVLEESRAQPTRMMPRNAPCWCGSGRKFKACHLRQPGLAPLTDRRRWLYAKGVVYALESDWKHLVGELGDIRTAGIDSDERAWELVNDGLVFDVALFEGGVFAEYVATRHQLLPADELLLAQQWLLTERSVYEVTTVEPGVAVTFRDLRTGDTVQALDSLASREVQPGQLVCCHLLPRPDGGHTIQTIDPVSLGERSALIELLDSDEPDPELLVAFLSRRFAPPTLANTEGHALVLCEVELQTRDPATLTARLDERFGPADAGDADQIWTDHVTVDGEQKIRAMVTLSGDTLHLSTNSEERRDLMLAELRALQPDLVEVKRSATDPREAMKSTAKAAGGSGGAVGAFGQPLAETPEVRTVMIDHIRAYEDRWLDLEIPALDGLTPRQAAEDPTRRDDLVRLLATFPAAVDETEMDPQRLRTLLGLPSPH